MKVECIKDKIRDAVLQADRISGKNLSLPVLAFIFLQAKAGELVVRSTNLELGLEIRIPARVDEEGEVVVPGSVLGGLLAGMGNEKSVKMTTKGGNLVLSASSGTSTLKCGVTEDFPTIPKVSDATSFSLPVETLLSGIRSVWYSASVSNIKPEISSVYMYKDNQDMFFVATDSFRLAEKRIHLKKDIQFSSLLIPYKNLVEIARVLEPYSGEVDIVFTKNQVSFTVESVYVTSRVVEGVFPDYNQIMPKEKKTEAIVLKQDLSNLIKVSNIFSDKFHKVIFRVEPSKKKFEVESRNADVGENTGKIDASLSGEDVEISFNYKYILDCFQSIKHDSVTLEFNGVGKPLVIRAVGDDSFTYLVMPMNR